MTSEEFKALSTQEKWMHIDSVMSYINQIESHYSLRARLNPHHTSKQRNEEVRSMRKDQYQRWSHVKDLYAENRDELSNTLGQDRFSEIRSIFERIFTSEVDDALRDVMGDE